MAENEDFVTTMSMDDTNVDHSPIELHLCKGKILAWNADDVKLLRVTHHIVGALVGSLPRSPRQNAQLSLPLQLMPEEAAVLIEYGVAKLVNVKIKTPSSDDVAAFKIARQRSFEEQKALLESENLKRKQNFAHVVTMGQMSKKQRRAERAKKLKREKAACSNPSEDCGDKIASREEKMSDDDKQDTVAMETQPQDSTENVSRDSDETTAVNVSEQSYFEDKIAAAAITSKPGTLTCMDTSLPNSSNYSPSEPGATSHTFKIHPAEVDKSENGQIPETVLVESRTLLEKDFESDEFGQKTKLDSHVKESCPQVKNVSTEGDDKFEKSQGSSELTEETTLMQESSGPEILERVPQLVPENLNQSSALAVTGSQVLGSPAETETDKNLKNEKQKSVSLGVEEASSDVFKKPSNPLPTSAYLVQLVTASPDTIKQEVTEWAFPSTQQESLRYRVFRDLWETGYYITSGCKFGGNFLVYPGDPFLFHSDFVAICIPHEKTLSPLDVITYGRLGTNVKKTVVLCSLDESDKVVYTSMQWTGIS